MISILGLVYLYLTVILSMLLFLSVSIIIIIMNYKISMKSEPQKIGYATNTFKQKRPKIIDESLSFKPSPNLVQMNISNYCKEN